jgi:hypothetical protein
MTAARDREARRFRPGPTALLAFYPRAWRRRYGDELDALILEMQADGRDTGARVRANLLQAAARERLHGSGDSRERMRGGACLLLWAWALFVVGGSIVAKTSEHWQQALPAAPDASAAFSALTWIAVGVAIAVACGIALALPATLSLLRDGGWPRLRMRVLTAAGLSVAAIGATAALLTWAHTLSASARNGHDVVYGCAFLAWVALLTASLLAWTALATRITAGVRLTRPVLRIHAWLVPAVAVAMAAMTVATLVWWATVAGEAPAALTGGSRMAHASPLVPALVLAAVLMLVATSLAGLGANRAMSAHREL